MMNKRKIINDPLYGFIHIPSELVFDIIEHPYFQRLRHIKQLGMTGMVYPGALHTRFHHALGATHLMHQAIEILRAKGNTIDEAEAEAAIIAILLHDIGHGPFSHALEYSLNFRVSHEALSVMFMQRLDAHFSGKLALARAIFSNNYHKPFLHELVSSQLDIDRLDYLNRDSFFTGVQEGIIGAERLLKMLDVHDNHLVVEEKGIYSVEKFLIARRLMYWQVYLHKTVICAEMMLVKVLQRAKQLLQQGHPVFASPALSLFLQNQFTLDDFEQQPHLLDTFALLDDTDVMAAIKAWQYHTDPVLSLLAAGLTNRRLLRIHLEKQPPNPQIIEQLTQKAMKYYGLSEADAAYLVFADTTSNSAYTYSGSRINIAYKNGDILDITDASDYHNLAKLATPVVKYYYCYPKTLH